MSDAVIRVAGAGDLPQLLNLYTDLNQGDPDPDPNDNEAVWSALLSSSMVSVLVAEAARRWPHPAH